MSGRAAKSTTEEGYNSLIIEWLTNLRNHAKRTGSKIEFTYLKALKSVKEHKEPIRSGGDCKKLTGFGEKTCALVDKKLKEHLGESYIVPEVVAKKRATPKKAQQAALRKRVNDPGALRSPSVASPIRKVARGAARNRAYIPAQGSSGFAILVSLLRYELEYAQKLVNKLDLQEMAQRYTTSLNGQATSAQRYAGWATVKTLLEKELVARTDERNSYFFLTDSGRTLAKNLAKVSPALRDFSQKYLVSGQESDNEEDVLSEDEEMPSQRPAEPSSTSTQPTFRPFIFKPDEYEIILCIDTRERIATNFCADKNAAFASALQKQDVRVEIRQLPLGDFVWIAREKPRTGDLGRFASMTTDLSSGTSSSTTATSAPVSDVRKELVLDLIIERKRIDDLAGSIKDRRWDEQKYRLLNCGIRRPTYLIEYMGKASKRQEHGSLKPDTLEQAMSNCEIDGFDVKRTDNFEETVRYLTFTSRWIERRYASQMLMSCPNKETLARTSSADFTYITFNEFAVNSGKINTFTAKEMLVKHLLHIKGLSLGKIQAIVSKYPTLSKLLQAYDRREDLHSKHNMLTDLKSDSAVGANRRLGPAVSRKVFEYYDAL